MPETLRPTYGLDAAADTDDLYTELVADGSATSDIRYHWIEAGVDTYSAIISLDGGTTGHLIIRVLTPATGGTAVGHVGPVYVEGGFVQVHAKNATATQDYTNCWCNVW